MFPAYRFDPALVWPECATSLVPVGKNSLLTATKANGPDRPLSAITLALAFKLGRGNFSVPSTISPQAFMKEVNGVLEPAGVPEDRAAAWADSILLPPTATLPDMSLVPRRMDALNFDLHTYQVDNAGWCAYRRGAVLAHGCGVGKTATAVAAAIAAKRFGTCSARRCFIIAPVNAFNTWNKIKPELQAEFQEVVLWSMDSLHLLVALDTTLGGAVIFDEAHSFKTLKKTARTSEAHHLRRCFDWGVTLTGSMLHTGAGGAISVQDLACPGLSRFMDDMAFGRAFGCIHLRDRPGRRGKTIKQPVLGLVSEEMKPEFATYLMRSTRSLSLKSEEVMSCVTVPDQTCMEVDCWAKPTWMVEPEWSWAPDLGWIDLLAQLSSCIRKEELEMATALVPELKAAKPDAIYARIEERLRDPFDPVHTAEDNVEQAKYMRLRLKNRGLPNFSRLIFEANRVGRLHKYIWCDPKRGYEYRAGPPGFEAPKIAWLREWFMANPKEPLVCAAAGTTTVNAAKALLDELKISHHIIRGGVSPEDRAVFEDAFQRGEVQVMLVQQKAGSVSITLTRAATTVLLDATNSPIDYEQLLARTCRQGQKRDCYHYDLIFGAMQSKLLTALKRGCMFDSTVRIELERQFRDASAIRP
jgi:hypothetical protein